MRETKAGFRVLHTSPAMLRTARFAAVALGIGLLMTAGAARAQDDEEDDSTFEEKIIKNIMAGVGGTNMENTGIDYRERSPLVVPPKIDLPPPASTSGEITAPNWPKDPDVKRRKAAIAASKKAKPSFEEASRPLSPAELNVGRTAAGAPRASNDPVQPGNSNTNPILSPGQLGFKGFSLFGSTEKTETAPFVAEPPRESLVQPPVGYQTPSPNFAYGTGKKELLVNKRTDIMTGKEVDN